MHSTAAGIDGLPTCLLRPRLLPAAKRAGDQPEQPQPGGPPAPAPDAAATSDNATAHIAAGLNAVFKRISATRAVPDSWRRAILVPIYKGKADITSYHPLSAPTVACRMWSSLTNKALMDAAEGVLPDTMFGFRPGLACA
jgi:hypothetical protein